jgi:hypothetical protein
MTLREQVESVWSEAAALHVEMIRDAEKLLAEEGTPRALTQEAVDRYRLHARFVKLMDVVALLADEIDHLKTRV